MREPDVCHSAWPALLCAAQSVGAGQARHEVRTRDDNVMICQGEKWPVHLSTETHEDMTMDQIQKGIAPCPGPPPCKILIVRHVQCFYLSKRLPPEDQFVAKVVLQNQETVHSWATYVRKYMPCMLVHQNEPHSKTKSETFRNGLIPLKASCFPISLGRRRSS